MSSEDQKTEMIERLIRERIDSDLKHLNDYAARRIDIEALENDLASARAANKAMHERINRLECEAEAQAMRHRETIQTLRQELAGVMQDE